MNRLALAALVLASLAGAAPSFAGTCPATITDAVTKAYPTGKITKCVAEKEDGVDQFEARVTVGATMLELDISTAGVITQIEQPIAVAELPAAVTKAFAAKYPKAKITRAEQMTAGTKVSYELAFAVKGKRQEATFLPDGAFVELE